MSIPGLGQIPVQADSATRRYSLAPLTEWRFAVSQPPIKVRLLAGTAERDGTELAAKQPYRFAGTQSKILTWHGCELEVEGSCDRDAVVALAPAAGGSPDGVPVVSYLNLHMLLAARRAAAAAAPGTAAAGPRLLVCGAPQTGRTSLVRMLAAWASKMTGASTALRQQQPLVVNADPREGMLTLPGTLSAAVFATLVDLETEGGAGWGGAPSSGPSAVPVKLPLVFHYGYARPADAPALYRSLATRLAGAVAARLSEDPAVRASGLLIDTAALGADGQAPEAAAQDLDLLAHLVEEFSVNMVVVLEKSTDGGGLHAAVARRLAGETTSLGEPVQVVALAASDGVVASSDAVQQQQREACIREYFFGDAKRTLSPYTQQVDADRLTVYRLSPATEAKGAAADADDEDDDDDPYDPEDVDGEAKSEKKTVHTNGNGNGTNGTNGIATGGQLTKFDAGPALSHWTLAVMNASLHDPPDVVQHASVRGFVYVAEVDGERRKVRILAPVNERMGDRPLVFGRWPEPYINLVG